MISRGHDKQAPSIHKSTLLSSIPLEKEYLLSKRWKGERLPQCDSDTTTPKKTTPYSSIVYFIACVFLFVSLELFTIASKNIIAHTFEMLSRTHFCRKGACNGLWIVADMDGTLTTSPSKSGGRNLPIDQSATFQPLCDFIRLGGSIFVLTNAGTFPFVQVWRPLLHSVIKALPPHKRDDRVVISPFSGAGLYHGRYGQDDMVEDTDFTERGLLVDGKETSTAISADCLPAVLREIKTTMQDTVFRLLDEDPSYLPLLSKKYRDCLPPTIQLRRELGVERFNREVLTLENLMEYGRFLPKTDSYVPLPLIDVQRTRAGHVVQINILATPIARFDQDIFPKERRDHLTNVMNLHVKRQPNSCTISRNLVNKGTAIDYMERKHTHNFSLARSIGLGDHPSFTDFPLTQYRAMPFVSVAPHEVSAHPLFPFVAQMNHLSGEEEGAAAFIATLVRQCIARRRQSGLEEDDDAPAEWDPSFVKMAADSCGVPPPTTMKSQP